METSQEERDELRDDPNPQPEDVRRVIDDADRLERIERQVRELADRMGPGEPYYHELCAIVDTKR